MKEVVSDLQRDFDFVLFDTPSAAVFADAATLATMTDAILFVVRANETPTGYEEQIKNLLSKTRARGIGIVLNDMPMQEVPTVRYHSHYYGNTSDWDRALPSTSRAALPSGRAEDDI
jgi:Mrp family chromosome partitioning ATPase